MHQAGYTIVVTDQRLRNERREAEDYHRWRKEKLALLSLSFAVVQREMALIESSLAPNSALWLHFDFMFVTICPPLS
jgi:hypothetical protein